MLTSSAFPRLALFFLLTAGALPARAQSVNTVQFSADGPGSAIGQLYPTAGGWLLPGQIRWGTDSSCLSLVRLDPALNVTRSRQYRLPALRRGFFSLPVPTRRGLVAGAESSSPRGQAVIGFDTAFAVRWSTLITTGGGLTFLTTHGPDIVVGYPFIPVPSSNSGFTRVWGSAATGTGWRGRRINGPTRGWRPLRPFAPDTSGIHYLTGDVGFPFIKLDTTKVYWSYLLSAGGVQDGGGLPIGAANGDLWVPLTSIPATGQPAQAILCRYDTAGTLLWNRRLAMTNHFLSIGAVAELPGGELLIGGSARVGPGGATTPILFRLSATGALVWAHRWAPAGGASVGAVTDIIRRPGGGYRLVIATQLTFIDLDANFNGCQFVDETANITVSQATITATPLPLTMTPLPIAAVPQAVRALSPVSYLRNSVCTAVGIEEEAAPETAALATWPQPLPRGERLHLTLPTGWNAAETRLTLTSALGQLVWRGPWAETVALPPNLPAGVWLLTVTDGRGYTATRRVLTE